MAFPSFAGTFPHGVFLLFLTALQGSSGFFPWLSGEYAIPFSTRIGTGPTRGWEEVIGRWLDCKSDVEEMNRCFALSRYAASVFHSTRVVEIGLIDLGKFLGIADPKSGWTAVANELKRIVSKKRENLTAFESQHFPFIEQVQGTVEALKNAWRNKISHAQSTPVLLTPDFTPDICEEIIIASRAFMRRLATEMP